MEKDVPASQFCGSASAMSESAGSGACRARSRVLRYLCGFASQVRDPQEAAELEQIAALVRQRQTQAEQASGGSDVPAD